MNSSLDFEDVNSTFVNDTEAYDYDNYILDDEGNIICEELTDEDRQFYANFAWWLEGVGQMIVGGIGFLANCVAIPILGKFQFTLLLNIHTLDNQYLL